MKLINKYKKVSFKIFSDENIIKFVSTIYGTSFNDVIEGGDPDNSFSLFYDRLIKIYHSCFPTKSKKISTSKKYLPWITRDIKKCIKKKYYLYSLWRRGIITKRSFVTYKNLLTWVINKSRNLYYIRKFSNEHDSKKVWNYINGILKRKKSDNEIELKDNNGLSVPDVPEYFNGYFTNIASQLVSHLPRNINFEYFRGMIDIVNSCSFYLTDEVEVASVIGNLPNKGNSLLEIKPNLLKKIISVVSPIIAIIFNKCFCAGIYPKKLKLARVIPVYKSGCRNLAENYRPISNLLVFNKIFDVLIYNRLLAFFEKHKILSDFQYGFRKFSNPNLAVFQLTSDILGTFRGGLFTAALFLDLRKAFDTVDIDLLLFKLAKCGIRGVSRVFLESYLRGRQQCVSVNGRVSKVAAIDKGVPQGSVLGPLLFNIYINDMPLLTTGQKIFFADDTVCYVTARTLAECIESMRNVIESITEWLNNNKLIANASKTKLMLFSPVKCDVIPDLLFNNEILEWVTIIKYLGVNIDNKLTFISHCKEIHRKLCKYHGVIYSIRNLLPKENLMSIYYSFIYSTITQNIIIWGGISRTHLLPISTKMNKILRTILKVRYVNYIPIISNDELYKQCDTLKIGDIYKLCLLKFIHLIFYCNESLFNRYFLPLLPSHSYNTRNSRINLPMARRKIERQAVIFQSCQLINSVVEEFLVPQSLIALKKNFKALCKSRY